MRFISGHNMRGKTHSAETRRKLSEANRGRVCSEETRRKMSEAHRGEKQSAETRKKKSEALRGDRAPRWSADGVSYSGAHARAWGVLSRACLHCGRAEGQLDAALRHDGSPSARRRVFYRGRWRSFSVKPEDYIPLCVSCHRKYDYLPDFGERVAQAVAA